MSDIPIQIVDENNDPVGSATKQEAWRDGLIHRVVRISILDKAGRLLVQKRSTQKELFPGRCDNSVAGQLMLVKTMKKQPSVNYKKNWASVAQRYKRCQCTQPIISSMVVS